MTRCTPVIICLLSALHERVRDEQQQYDDHQSDDYQRGRAMASEQIEKMIQEIISG